MHFRGAPNHFQSPFQNVNSIPQNPFPEAEPVPNPYAHPSTNPYPSNNFAQPNAFPSNPNPSAYPSLSPQNGFSVNINPSPNMSPSSGFPSMPAPAPQPQPTITSPFGMNMGVSSNMAPNAGMAGAAGPGVNVNMNMGADMFNSLARSVNNPLAQMGLEYMGKTMAANGNLQIAQIGQSVSRVKYYFDVNNSYVLNKVKVLLCPFLHKGTWVREAASQPQFQGQELQFASPRADINAPDLYIPLMSFITYILFIGLALGTGNRFTPEVLGMTASRGFGTLLLELLLLKLGFYMLSIGVPFLDLVAYSGYKYVGLVANIIVGLILGSTGYYLFLLYIAAMMGFFLVKTLQRHTPNSMSSHMGFQSASDSARSYLLWAVGALQLPIFFFLGPPSDTLY